MLISAAKVLDTDLVGIVPVHDIQFTFLLRAHLRQIMAAMEAVKDMETCQKPRLQY
jgi:hypothetical protein